MEQGDNEGNEGSDEDFDDEDALLAAEERAAGRVARDEGPLSLPAVLVIDGLPDDEFVLQAGRDEPPEWFADPPQVTNLTGLPPAYLPRDAYVPMGRALREIGDAVTHGLHLDNNEARDTAGRKSWFHRIMTLLSGYVALMIIGPIIVVVVGGAMVIAWLLGLF